MTEPSAPTTGEASRVLGLHQVFPERGRGTDATIDIIAIHGLDTASPRTWIAYEREGSHGPEGRAVNWLCDPDMLPSVVPDARIFTYDYDANYHRDAPVQTLLSKADNMLAHISEARIRDKSTARPIIFFASCFGGLVLVEALNRAVPTESPHHDLLSLIVGVLFLGTPLRGTRAAKAANWRAYVAGIMGQQASDVLIRDLDEESGVLQNLVQKFAENANSPMLRLPIHCFFECQPTEILRSILPRSVADRFSSTKTNIILVNEASACLDGFGRTALNVKHALINKFRGPNDPNFVLLAPIVRKFVTGAQEVLGYRRSHGTITKNVHWSVTRSVNSLFTGRAEELKKMKQALLESPPSPQQLQKRFIVTGIGGQGKSELCLKVAEELRQELWGVFWVDVSDASLAKVGFTHIARMMGSSAEDVDQARQLLATIQENWLLILDNADDGSFDYSEYFPSGNHGCIILTSRDDQFQSAYETAGSISLDALTPGDAVELLFRAARIPQEKWPSSSDAAKEVIKLLGSHALALVQAGAYIARRCWKLDQYPKEFRKQRNRLLASCPKQARSRYGSVYATFEASAAVLCASEDFAADDALRLLELFSMLHFSRLPMVLFEAVWKGCQVIGFQQAGESYAIDRLSKWHVDQVPEFLRQETRDWDPRRLEEAISILASFSLITRNDSGLTMHPLVHAWAKDRQNLGQQQAAWITTGSVIALSTWLSYNTWRIYQRVLHPHMRAFLETEADLLISQNYTLKIAQIHYRCAEVLRLTRDDYGLASLLDDMSKKLGDVGEHLDFKLIPLYRIKAQNSRNFRDFHSAIKILNKIEKCEEMILGNNHPDRLLTQHTLARTYRKNGRISKAIEIFQHITRIEESLAENNSNRLSTQLELARAYRANGQISEAIELLKHVVQIRKTTLAENHPSQLTSQHELARAYRANGQISEAIELFEHVVRIRETTLAENHPDRLASQHSFAHAYRANGQISEAIKLFEHVVQVRKIALAENHPDRLASEHELACAYQDNGQISEAIELFEHVVRIRETTLAENHPDRLSSERWLAWLKTRVENSNTLS